MIVPCTCRRCHRDFQVEISDEVTTLLPSVKLRPPTLCDDCNNPDKPLSQADRETCQRIRDGDPVKRHKAIVNWGNLLAAARRPSPNAGGHLSDSQLEEICKLNKMLAIVNGEPAAGQSKQKQW